VTWRRLRGGLDTRSLVGGEPGASPGVLLSSDDDFDRGVDRVDPTELADGSERNS